MNAGYHHVPVLLDGVLEALAPSPGLVMGDCTIGLAGHARELLPRLAPGGRLIGLDLDPSHVERAGQALRDLQPTAQYEVRQSNFAALPSLLAELGIEKLNGILADL